MSADAVALHPLADRVAAAVEAAPDERRLEAGKELLLCSEDELPQVLERWESPGA